MDKAEQAEVARLAHLVAAAPFRLHRLAERVPDHARILQELAALLTTPAAGAEVEVGEAPASPAGTPPPPT